MGIFSFLGARGKALTGTPAVLEIAAARSLNTYIPLGGTNLNYGRINQVYVEAQNASYGWMYRYQPSIRTVIEYLARNIAQLSLKVFERVADDRREQRGDHPAAVLLRRPNDWTPGPQFIYELVTDFLIYDNAYALKIRNPRTNVLDTIVRIEPPMVGIVGQSHFQVDAYRIYRTDGTAFDVSPEDMLHWRGYNPSDPRKGESKLETLRELMAADLAARQGVTEIFRAGMMQGGWIERPLEAPPLKPEGADRLRESLTNMGKSSNKRFGLLEEGMKFSDASVTPEDAQYLAARQSAIEEVNAIYGLQNVPPQNEEERKQVYADVLPPYTTIIASFLNLQLLQQEYDADDYYFEFGREKMMDEIYKTLTSATGRPIMLTDEGRAKIDLPPVPGGDVLVQPLNVGPLTDKPSTGVMPIQDPNKPPQDGSHRTEDVPTPPGKSVVKGKIELNGHLGGSSSVATPTNGHHKGHLIPRRAQIDHSRNIWAGKYEETLTKHFSRQQRSVVAKGLSKSLAAEALSEERWDKELASDLQELSQRHFNTAGDAYAFRVASEFDPDYGQNWLTAKAEESAKAINQTTQEHVEESGVTEAFALAASVRAAGAGKGYATDVHAFSAKVALEQDPNREVRSVTITGGDCEVCAEFQGTYPVDEVPAWPSYHQNCDCQADIDSGGKSMALQTKQLETMQVLAKAVVEGSNKGEVLALAKAISEQKPAQVTVEPAQTHIHEGAVNSHTTVEAPPPVEVTIAEGAVQVDASTNVEAPPPAEVTIQKGAVQNHVKVDSPPPAEVNVAPAEVNVAPAEVRFGKGAINVEAPPPANVNIEEGAIKVEPSTVNVEAPEVNVTTPAVENHIHVPKEGGKKKVTFSDGSEAKIEETDERPADA